MRTARHFFTCVRTVLAVACLFAPRLLIAQDAKPTEYQVKAAYLTNLGRFVSQWSGGSGSSADETFNICVLGRDPFGPDLDRAVKGEKIGGSALAAKRITGLQEASGCRILFISSADDAQIGSILASLGATPVLTVSDIPDFAKRGGMIQFILDGNHVRFEINIAAARRSGLTLSSELLKIARAIRRTP